ncbi:hypothetical protein TVAG_342850 [Trichomonas vaginalis G3]|uniref:Uncharacterized protein n=1 Tax=Trichomonas vaginalis (strain ATCC PRA-98 / G3) TaxID=412133 RepID=A2EJP7_TRIV3|nr:hypothetical protein TVAGG3_0579670 [Trichomonas vaginalis G3]EAY07121.1 hypothetical protein TVAG_342850 [Trichomonas vaginalis G3]KAI5522476.1 hypothetical protein TVAGG3_0579670 [Trichomonas vaginalis G3]|eukprot:XP_001319344.1 hypothetical protein [Trichomonas vaginalis G3]
MEKCFSFISPGDTLENIMSDLQCIISDRNWSNLVEYIGNRSNNLNSKFDDIKRDKSNIEILFTTYTPSEIASYFIAENDSILFINCLSLLVQKNPFAKTFIDTVLRISPKSVKRLNISSILGTSEKLDCFFQRIFDVYFQYHNEIVLDIIKSFQIRDIIIFLFEKYKFNEDHYDNFLKTLATIYMQENFDNYLKEQFEKLIMNENYLKVGIFLDFLEVASICNALDYKDKFQELVSPFSNSSFVKYLAERSESNKSKNFGRIQLDVLPQSISSPLKRKYMAEILEIESDDILISLADVYYNSRVIPKIITEIFYKNRAYFDNILVEKITRLSSRYNTVKVLQEELVNLNMIERPKIANDFDNLINHLKNGFPDSDRRLLQAFKDFISDKDQENLPIHCCEFEQEVLMKLPPKIKANIAQSLVETLKKNIDNDSNQSNIDKHARTQIIQFNEEDSSEVICFLILRLPINRLMQDFMVDDPSLDCKRLILLHNAAIKSSKSIVFRGKPLPKYGVYIDSFIVQRLRWRYNRGDTLDSLCLDYRFLGLAEDDIALYIKWETTTNPPMSQEMLSSINLGSKEKKVQAFNGMIKLQNVDDKIARTFLASIDISCINDDDLVFGEVPNVTFLSMTPFIWNRKVLYHPHVIDTLKHPDFILSCNLLYLLDQQKHKMLLSNFPHAFAAILYQYSYVSSIPAPDIIKTAILVIENKLSTPIKDQRKNFFYAVVSTIARHGWDIVKFMEIRPEMEWTEPCIVFSICESKFPDAIQILKRRQIEVSEILKKSIPYEELFFGVGTWISKRVEFAVHCASQEIIISNQSWNDFLMMAESEANDDQKVKIRNYLLLCSGSNNRMISNLPMIARPGYV